MIRTSSDDDELEVDDEEDILLENDVFEDHENLIDLSEFYELLDVPKKNFVNIMTLNINSARNKSKKLELLAAELDCDFIFLNEVDQNEKDIFLRSGWIVGFDLIGFQNKEGRCGGVAVLASTEISANCQIMDFASSLPKSHQIVAFILADFLIAAIYRSPNATSDEEVRVFKAEITKITSKARTLKKNVILAGDINPGSFDFELMKGGTKIQAEICKHFVKRGLTQLVNEYTFEKSKNVLDLVLTNATGRISYVNVIDHDISNHRAVYFQVLTDIKLSDEIEVDDFRNADWSVFVSTLESLEWPRAKQAYPRHTTVDDLNHFYQMFVNNFLIAKKAAVPKKTVVSRKVKSRLIDSEIEKLLKLRRAYRSENDIHGLAKTDEKLKKLRDEKISQERNAFLKNLEMDKFAIYAHMDETKTDKIDVPYTGVYRNYPEDLEIVNDPLERANILQDYFISNQKPQVYMPWVNYDAVNSEDDLVDIVITPADVQIAIAKLGYGNSCGADLITKTFLKLSAHIIADSLCDLSLLIMDVMQLPDLQKIVTVTPIPKSKKFLIPKWNRPIACQSEVLKVVEGIMLNYYVSFLVKSGRSVPETQFAYQKSRGVLLLLLCHWTKLMEVLTKYHTASVLHLDLSKVCYRIPPICQSLCLDLVKIKFIWCISVMPTCQKLKLYPNFLIDLQKRREIFLQYVKSKITQPELYN